MVGITYTHFNAGDPCWIVVDSPIGKEYFRGEFLRELPDHHPSYTVVRETMPAGTKAVAVKIIDTRVMERHPIEALEYGQEPYRNYTVMPSNAYTNHMVQEVEQLRSVMQRARERIGTLENILIEVASKKE